MIPSLLDLAFRALLVAAAVWAGLRILGVRDVLAQKAAWGLVLAAAVLMPLLLPLALRWQILPSSITFTVPAHPVQKLVGALARPDAAPSASLTAPASDRALARKALAGSTAPAPEIARVWPAASHSHARATSSTIETPLPLEPRHPAVAPRPLLPTIETLAVALYIAVCLVFVLRLLYGLTTAIFLWLDAKPVDSAMALDNAAGLRLRSSRAVSSPVTIGSGIILPDAYDEWDAEKLRIVLAHERSHIRQGDFYLQLLAGVYAALFWFSPLGWWLKRKLSDLGEAISDRAGLEQAASRSSYAQILLEFAAAPRPTLIGVAMARPSSLAHRIDRLLNDSSFSHAFSVSRRRALVAVLLVPAALFAATAFVRVEAARQAQPIPPAPAVPAVQPQAPVQAQAPTTGQSQPEAAVEPVAPIAPIALVAPPASYAPVVALAPVAPVQATAPAPAAAPPPPSDADTNVSVGPGQSLTITNTHGRHHSSSVSSGTGQGYSFSFRTGDEDSYALVTQPSGGVRFSGDWIDGRRLEIEKAGKVAQGGKFLWFSHDGKSYVIDDPAIIASIEAMYKPMDDLGRQQDELGKKQDELGRQRDELGRRQEQASVPTPDVSKEMAELNAALAKLQSKKTITQEEIGDLQSKIGDIQSRIGDIEGKIGEEQGRLGEEQGKLGEQQGKLGEEQGRLGEEQGRIAGEADRKVRAIMADSLKNGKARPVE